MKRWTHLVYVIFLAVVIAIGSKMKTSKKTAEADDGLIFELNTCCENLSDEFKNNQEIANGIYSRLFDQLIELHGTAMDDSVYTVNGVRAEYFPPYFGGAYINIEGKLIVQIVEEYYSSDYRESEWYRSFIEMVGREEFYCHPVRYSYSELIEAISEVSMGSLSEAFSDLGIVNHSASIDDYRNQIEICVYSQDEYILVTDLLDSDIYYVTIRDEIPQFTVGLYPGEGITTQLQGINTFSLTCRVRRNFPGGTYAYGFLTCAHTFFGTENVYVNLGTGMSNNTLLGISYSFNQALGGNADVAYVETNSNTTVSNVVYSGTTILDPVFTSVAQGTTVYKRGMTTGITYATVIAASCSDTISNIYFYDIVKVGVFAAPGDSGGIVYTTPVSGHAKCVGITLGSAVTVSYYSKMSNNIAALQSGPITYSLY